MKYIIETDAPLSDIMIASLKQVRGMAHIKSIEPLEIDENLLDRLARREIGDSFGWPDRDEDGNDKYKLRDAFKAGYKKALG